jgi:CheY-like chemotaxis protein/HPt (histidine-containing phosphotransfer) domain-containing protein
MTDDAIRPTVLVVATANHPLLPPLADALAAHGLGCQACSQAAQMFICMARPDAPGERWVLAIILEGVSGMTVPALGRSLRGLPGRSGLPLLLVDGQTTALVTSLALPPPVTADQLARLAATPPGQWTSAPATTTAPASAAAGDSAPATGIILVVDDQEVNRMIMRLQVRAAGLPTEVCADGAAAVARVAAGGIRLVLMDCQMPIMDGYEATRAIRQAEAGTIRHLPIIAVTAHDTEENRQRCLDVGMDDFLAKPLTREQLLVVLRRWLQDPPTDAPASDPSARVVFDPTPLRTIDRGTPGVGRQLADILLADLVRAQANFQQLLADGALDALGRAAHKLKGASGSLGAMELSQACSDLEQATRHQDDLVCRQKVADVLLAIARLQPHLTACAASLTKG